MIFYYIILYHIIVMYIIKRDDTKHHVSTPARQRCPQQPPVDYSNRSYYPVRAKPAPLGFTGEPLAGETLGLVPV